MMPGHSPTMRRRRLAAELRRLRENAGLTQEEVAGQLEWDPSKLSRIENRQVGIIARDLRKLLDLYAVIDENQREGYFAMARRRASSGPGGSPTATSSPASTAP